MRRLSRSSVILAAWLPVACASEAPVHVAPDTGSQAGGEAIRIEGGDFVGHGPPIVYIGARAAKAVVVESRWLITAVTPQSEDPRAVDVRVLFEDGTAIEIPAGFTYIEQEGLVLQPNVGG
jgi:hypothetical protein